MLRTMVWMLLLLAVAACDRDPAPPAVPATPPLLPEAERFRLVIGGNGFQVGMGLADLRARFGEAAVVEAPVPLGAGAVEPGAIIHHDDPSRRAYVHFVDGRTDGAIAAIQVRDASSIWRGPFEIRIGMTMAEIERINGKPLRFLGFDWDYGGYASHYGGGQLESALLAPGRLLLRFEPPPADPSHPLPEDYPRGDAEFSSALPAVRAHSPVLAEFGVSFGP
jgi:hypothetical protein